MLCLSRSALSSRRAPLVISLKISRQCLRTLSSSSSSTWNWNNLASGGGDSKDSGDGNSNNSPAKGSKESQVLKKCSDLYLSLMPLNDQVSFPSEACFYLYLFHE